MKPFTLVTLDGKKNEQVTDVYELTHEEVEFLSERYKQLRANKAAVIRVISDALGSALPPGIHNTWDGWPGTIRLAEAVHRALVADEILLKEKLADVLRSSQA